MKECKNANNPNMIKYTAKQQIDILRVAVEQIDINVFVYDTLTERVYFFNKNIPILGEINKNEYSVQEIIDNSIVDEESMKSLKDLFKSMHNGEKMASAVIKTVGAKSLWHHIMLVNYFNEAGKSIRVVGTIQDVSLRIETELRYSKEKQLRLAMLADANRVYEVNVTKDRFIKLESIQDTTDYDTWELYTNSMANLCKNNVYREDWETFLKVATRENLIEGYAHGITEFYCEYRTLDENGNIAWASSATHLLKDPVTNDIKGFIYVKNIDKQKRIEIELYQQAERDPLTGIYNRRTAERLITQRLISSKEGMLHGFLTIDLDEFKQVNDKYGHLKGDELLQEVANKIGHALRGEDIFARIGGDEFAVFINEAGSVEHILSVAYRLCECVRDISLDEITDFHTTISVGIAMYPKDGSTFVELYKNSDSSLYKVKQHGKNNVAFFSPADVG